MRTKLIVLAIDRDGENWYKVHIPYTHKTPDGIIIASVRTSNPEAVMIKVSRIYEVPSNDN